MAVVKEALTIIASVIMACLYNYRRPWIKIFVYYSVRKVSDIIFCFENLVNFNEARLHEATLNLHTHA